MPFGSEIILSTSIRKQFGRDKCHQSIQVPLFITFRKMIDFSFFSPFSPSITDLGLFYPQKPSATKIIRYRGRLTQNDKFFLTHIAKMV